MSIHDSHKNDPLVSYTNIMNRADGLEKAIADTWMDQEIGIIIAHRVLYSLWAICKNIDMSFSDLLNATIDSIANKDKSNDKDKS